MRLGNAIQALRKSAIHNRRSFLLFGLLVFLAGLGLSLYNIRNENLEFSALHCIMIAVLITPLTILISSIQLRILASTLNNPISFFSSAQITLAAMASNMLPVPGAIMVKTVAIAKQSGDLKKSATINAVSAAQWIGISMLFLSIMSDSLISPVLRLALFCLSGVFITTCLAVWIKNRLNVGQYLSLLATQPILVGIEISMYMLAFKAIGLEIEIIEATLYSCATIVGSLAGIIPGGIGVREAVAALLAESISRPGNAAFLATATGRIMTTGGLAVIAAAAALHKRNHSTE